MKNMIHLHPATVRKWVRKFNEQGIQGLQIRRGGGAPARISLGQKAEIIRIASKDPQELGLPFRRWSLPKIRDYLRTNQILDEVSTEWIRKILRSAGIVLSRSRLATKPAQEAATSRRREPVVERKARTPVASKKAHSSSATSAS
jgi:transposase